MIKLVLVLMTLTILQMAEKVSKMIGMACWPAAKDTLYCIDKQGNEYYFEVESDEEGRVMIMEARR